MIRRKNRFHIKAFFFLFLIALSISSACSSPKPEVGIPEMILTRFKAIYPNAEMAAWEKANGGYEVTFTFKGSKLAVLFLTDGAVERTKFFTGISSLPANVPEYLAENFPGQEIMEVSKIVDGFGAVTWEVHLGETGYLFSTQGQLLGQIATPVEPAK